MSGERVPSVVVDVAAAGYMLLSELECPAPDFTMRREYQRRLSEVVRTMSVEERQWLKRRAVS